MEEEHKEDEHVKHEEKHVEHKSRRFPFKIKLTKWSIISIIILIVFLFLVSIPTYLPKGECEVARPNYECASLKDVMIENCVYWGDYKCDTNADVSLPQIEWYIGNLCGLQNQYHNTGLDCSDLKSVCNQITGNQTCPIGYLG
jgi:hypothetical protein